MKNKRMIYLLLLSTSILLIPLLAMQFTQEVNWKTSDFFVSGILLFGTALLTEFILRKVKNIKYRVLVIATLLIGFLLIWTELAVGLFDTPLAGS